MRIFFLLAEDPFYTPGCCRRVLDRWAAPVVGVAFPPGFWSRKRLATTFRLYGPGGVLRKGCRAAVARFRGGAVHREFRARAIPIYPVPDVNGPEFARLLRDLGADLVVSVNCPQKLGKAVLGLPRLGCVNVHFGLLPKYRGVLPIMYAILNGEPEFAVTIHYMDEKLDNGDIIVQEPLAIGPADTLETLYPKAFEVAADLLCRALEQMESGTVVTKPNPEAEKTYYSYPSAEVARRYRRLARQRRRLRGSDAGWVAPVGSSLRPN